jgi:hypothetical protein
MKYFCKICNYDTDDISNFNRHNRSTKHNFKSIVSIVSVNIVEKSKPTVNQSKPTVNQSKKFTKKKSTVFIGKNDIMVDYDADTDNNSTDNKSYTCDFCEFTSIHKQSLSRHKTRCSEKNLSQKESKEAELQKIIEKKDEEVKYFKTIAEKAGSIAEQNSKTAAKSVSALTFLMQNYNNAPALTQIPEIRYDEIADKKFSLSETVIHYYLENRLTSYLGDCVVTFYKKDNPHDNSFWTSDLTRTTFYYRNEELTWVIDKIARRVGKKIIDPMLEHIKKKLEAYNRVENTLSRKRNQTTLEMGVHVKNNSNGMDVIRMIEKGVLKKNIIKYISQYFHLDRDLKQIEYTKPNNDNVDDDEMDDKMDDNMDDNIDNDITDDDKSCDDINDNADDNINDDTSDSIDDRYNNKMNKYKTSSNSHDNDSESETNFDELNADWIIEHKKKYGF